MNNKENEQVVLYAPHTDLVMAVMRSPKLGQTPEPEALTRFARMIDAVALIMDAKRLGAGDADMIAALVVAQVRQEPLVANLTWEEAGKALQDGAFGKYGEVYKLSAATIFGFLTAYALSDEKTDINRKVVALRTDEERRRQEKVAEFLKAHPAYAEIARKNYIENQKLFNKR